LNTNLTGAQFREMLLCAYEALSTNQKAINELNSSPSRTATRATNMTLTVSAAALDCRS
jgi:dihydroxyacetone kinase-like predicted kinase